MMTTVKDYKLERLKIIFNDDIAIIDFLADLQDRTIIRHLELLIKEADDKTAMSLYNSVADHMVILLVIKEPFGFNEGDNKLVLYADNDLYGLCHYFKRLLEHTAKDKGAIYTAIEDITAYLFLKWNNEIKDNDYARYGRAT